MVFRTFISPALHLLSSSSLQIVIGFLSNVVLARLLDVEYFGIYAVVFATIGIVRAVFTFNTGVYAIRSDSMMPCKLVSYMSLWLLNLFSAPSRQRVLLIVQP